MPIDFHATANGSTYSGREADESWRSAVLQLADPAGARVIDVGCGGGTYTRAWHELGAASVMGVDFSAPILDAASDSHGHLASVEFRQGAAGDTGLPSDSADIVWERALLHHVPDLRAAVAEAHRLLRVGGVYLIQDRTLDDVAQPPSAQHPRGWFFEVFPWLIEVENVRRPATATLADALSAEGFTALTVHELWEVRRVYADREQYLDEIQQRTGRSILHELSDPQLSVLVTTLRERLPAGPLQERDRWTLWRAVRAAR